MRIKAVRKLLRDALSAARLSNANFDNLGDPKSILLAKGEVTAFVKERTRLYRQTWIEGRIEQALELLGEQE